MSSTAQSKQGYLAIATSTAPTSPLTVAGAIRSTSIGFIFPDSTTQATAATGGTNYWTLSGTNLFPTSTSYNVGIGTTNPTTKFESAGSNATTFNAAGFYNTYAFGDSNLAEARINMGKIEGTTRYPMAAIGGFPSSNTNSTEGEMALYSRTGGALVERVRIKNSGNVGIGTTSPGQKLHVLNAAAVNDALTYPFLVDAGTDATLGPLSFYVTMKPSATGANRYVALSSGDSAACRNLVLNPIAGNVGIGTTGPAQKLSVAGTIESTSGGFKFPNGSIQTVAATGGTLSCTTVTASATNAGVTATCATGYVVTGGGCYTLQNLTDLGDYQEHNYPSGNGWYCARIMVTGGSAVNVTAYAQCCKIQ